MMNHSEQPTRLRTMDGALDVQEQIHNIKGSLPKDHSYSIHGTQHVDVFGGSYAILRVDPACEWCRRTFRLGV